MILHRVEPGHVADNDLILLDVPVAPQPTTTVRIGTEVRRVDTVRDHQHLVRRISMPRSVVATGVRVHDDQISEPGKSSSSLELGAMKPVVTVEFHVRGPHAPDDAEPGK